MSITQSCLNKTIIVGKIKQVFEKNEDKYSLLGYIYNNEVARSNEFICSVCRPQAENDWIRIIDTHQKLWSF